MFLTAQGTIKLSSHCIKIQDDVMNTVDPIKNWKHWFTANVFNQKKSKQLTSSRFHCDFSFPLKYNSIKGINVITTEQRSKWNHIYEMECAQLSSYFQVLSTVYSFVLTPIVIAVSLRNIAIKNHLLYVQSADSFSFLTLSVAQYHFLFIVFFCVVLYCVLSYVCVCVCDRCSYQYLLAI